jgi:hypothetical protein
MARRDATSWDVSCKEEMRRLKSFSHGPGVFWVLSAIGNTRNVSDAWAIIVVKRMMLV